MAARRGPAWHGHDRADAGGRDVLALPPEGVTNAVDEVVVPVLVAADEVGAAEPRIALLEHVAQNLRLGCGAVGVAVEALAGLHRMENDLRNQLADFAWGALDAKS